MPLAVDRGAVRRHGPGAGRSGRWPRRGGNFARHDPDKLAAAVLEIYRQRAVRIFRGKERYIIEE
ncbi:MAG: hypothetical protein ACLR0P_12950 [Oscillospiraceae bacterium]